MQHSADLIQVSPLNIRKLINCQARDLLTSSPGLQTCLLWVDLESISPRSALKFAANHGFVSGLSSLASRQRLWEDLRASRERNVICIPTIQTVVLLSESLEFC